MPHTAVTQQVAFIGAGKMATALVRGFIQQQVIEKHQVIACDLSALAREQFIEETGAGCVELLAEVVPSADFLFLAIKPQHLPMVCQELATLLKPEQTVISIAAGIKLSQLNDYLSGHARLVRIMPNTPALVGCGASGVTFGPEVEADDAAAILSLMNSVGVCEQVREPLMDAITGLSGSGPAYVFQFIEALSDAGVLNGLTREQATRLAAQTVMGAARMVLETGQHPGALKDAVASPAGTTIAGLAALDKNGFRNATIQAVSAAVARSQELGQ